MLLIVALEREQESELGQLLSSAVVTQVDQRTNPCLRVECAEISINRWQRKRERRLARRRPQPTTSGRMIIERSSSSSWLADRREGARGRAYNRPSD